MVMRSCGWVLPCIKSIEFRKARIRAGLTYLGRVYTILVGPPQFFFTIKTDNFFSRHSFGTLYLNDKLLINDNFHICLLVGPPMWWGLMCTCTLCTLDNPALDRIIFIADLHSQLRMFANWYLSQSNLKLLYCCINCILNFSWFCVCNHKIA